MPSSQSKTQFIIALITLIAIAMTVLPAIFGFKQLHSLFYRTTDGVLTEVTIHSGAFFSGKSDEPRSSVSVKYRYQINGVEYRNNQLTYLVVQGWSREDMKGLVDEYRLVTGATIPVHYNPDDPQDSVLIRGFIGWQLKNFVLALLLAFAIYGGARVFKLRKSPTS